MFLSFRNLSIRKKLTLLMVAISLLILTLVTGLYIAEEVYTTRTFLKQEMETLGETIGDNCTQLLLRKETRSIEAVLKSLKVQSNIHAAYLFNVTGEPVAQYLDADQMQFVLHVLQQDFQKPNESFWKCLPGAVFSQGWTHLSLLLPIRHEGHQIGSLYLLSDLHNLYARLNAVAFIVLLLLGLLILLSWWLSGKLQHPVSGPLLQLVETMGEISRRKLYALRVEKQGLDEIGQLVDGFNQMLGEIEKHRQELVAHQQSLEATVAERTEDLQQMVEVLELAKQQAEAASEAKSQFLASITHELRTPLVGVLGMNELLRRTSMDEQQRMLAATVQSSGEDLLTLINNVLDFSKIEAGKLQLEQEEICLYRIVDEVLGLLTGTAAEKGLTLYNRVSYRATCRVLGDELRLRQIVMNLVGNAVKFTEQGSVTVSLDCQPLESGAAEFLLQVQDTGIGMDAAAQEQIFSAFYQADTSHTRKFGGSGLGLAIVLQLIQLLDGEISLESELGQGSCFRVRFCLPQVAASELALPSRLEKRTALLCLTDPLLQEILLQRLNALGLRTVAAESATDFWHRLEVSLREQQPFPLLFLAVDCQLPDGRPLYSALRELPEADAQRRILLLPPAQSVSAAPLERKLYLPLCWDALVDTIGQLWHELRLVEKPQPAVEEKTQKLVAQAQVRLLLVGGNVVNRERIRLSLTEQPIQVVMAAGIAEAKQQLQQSAFDLALLLETALVEEFAPIWHQEEGRNGRLSVLLAETEQPEPFAQLGAICLEQPFCPEVFLEPVQALLGHQQRTSSGAGS